MGNALLQSPATTYAVAVTPGLHDLGRSASPTTSVAAVRRPTGRSGGSAHLTGPASGGRPCRPPTRVRLS